MKTTTAGARTGASLRLTLASCAVSSALLLTACGGGGGGGGNGPDDGDGGTDQQSGVFLDSVVDNIDYVATPSETDGTTNEFGAFNYEAGDEIVFSIGGVSLPAVPADEIVTPLDMGDGIDHARVVNVLQLLQSLDSNGDLSDGIKIDEDVKSAAADEDLDFDSENFDTDAGNFLSNVAGGDATLTSEDDAKAHFRESLAEEGVSDDDSIVGSYYDADTVVVFAADGSFYTAYFDPDGGDTGLEAGTYSYVGDEIRTSIPDDRNGDKGFNDGGVYTVVSGGSSEDPMTASAGGTTLTLDDGSGEFSLTSLGSVSGELSGAWRDSSGDSVLVFDGPATPDTATYYHLQIEEENGDTGVERGSADYNETVNELSSSSVTEDTNDGAGLDGNTYTATVDGDSMDLAGHSFARIDQAGTSDGSDGGGDGGSTEAFQASDVEDRIFQYEVTAGNDSGIKGFMLFNSDGTTEGLDFNEFYDGEAEIGEEGGEAWPGDWDISNGKLKLDDLEGSVVTVTREDVYTNMDGNEVYTVSTDDDDASGLVMHRSFPFESSTFSDQTYVVDIGEDGSATIDFGNNTFNDGGTDENMTWSVDSNLGYLEIVLPEEDIIFVNLGDTTPGDGDFDDVLVVNDADQSESEEEDYRLSAAWPGSTLTRQ